MNPLPIGKQVSLPGHFDAPVTLEAARPLGRGYECRVRLPDGSLDEAVITAEEAAALAGDSEPVESKTTTFDAEQLRLLVESARIRWPTPTISTSPSACPVSAPYHTRSKLFT